MSEFVLFISTFVLVFFLGTQSLSVNNGHYKLAFINSFFIGTSQMVLFKLAPDANWSEAACFLAGGPLGITASMYAHPHMVRILKKRAAK